MNGLTPVEHKRIKHINYVMADLHTSLNTIYEHLIDKEYTPLKGEVTALTKKLRSVGESVTDEV
jgi:lysophospholipase L1-like esterase